MDPQLPITPPPAQASTPRKRTPEELAQLWATGEDHDISGSSQTQRPEPPFAANPPGAPITGRMLPPPSFGSRTKAELTPPPPPGMDFRPPGGFTGQQVKSVTSRVAAPIGSMVGGTLGAEGGPGTAIVSAGAGAQAADLAAMALETSVGEPPSMKEFTTRTLSAFPEGAAGEAGGQALGVAVKGFSRSLTKEGRNAVDFANQFLKGKITPAQAVDSPTIGLIENVLEGSMFGGGRYHAFIGEQMKDLTAAANEIVNQFGKRQTTEQAGKAVQDVVKARTEGLHAGLRSSLGAPQGMEAVGELQQDLLEAAHTQAKKAGSALYDDVDRLAKEAGGVQVSLDPLKEFAAGETANRGRLAMALEGGKSTGIVSAVDKNIPAAGSQVVGGHALDPSTFGPVFREALMDANVSAEMFDAGHVTFRQAHEIRAALGRIERRAARSTDEGAGLVHGTAVQLKNRIDQAMTDAAGGAETPLRQAYDTATAAWKKMADTFQQGVLQDAMRTEPRLVLPTIIAEGRVKDIVKAKTEIGPEGWKAVQAQHLDSLLKDKAGRWVQGDVLQKRLTTLKPETVEAIYGKDSAASLNDIAQALSDQGTVVRNPERVVASIIKKKSAGNIEKMKTILGGESSENWRKVMSAHAESLLFNGSGPEATLKTGEELMRTLNALSPETMTAAYGRVSEGFWQLGRVLEQIQRKRPGTGKVAIQLAQGGAAAGLFLGGFNKSAGAILLTPAVLARVMLNPTVRKWLITGLKEGAEVSPMGRRALSNLVTWGVREGLMDVTNPRAQGAAPEIQEEPGRGQGAGGRGRNPLLGPGGPPPPPPGSRSGGSVTPGTVPPSQQFLDQFSGQQMPPPPARPGGGR